MLFGSCSLHSSKPGIQYYQIIKSSEGFQSSRSDGVWAGDFIYHYWPSRTWKVYKRKTFPFKRNRNCETVYWIKIWFLKSLSLMYKFVVSFGKIGLHFLLTVFQRIVKAMIISFSFILFPIFKLFFLFSSSTPSQYSGLLFPPLLELRSSRSPPLSASEC